ncbi:MAG: hypothetical protein HYU81_02655 [Candidatus Brennerbacteria bacterium]|nr:hypothetical protein [Candidatus Brennerbacteria bacterium]
MGVRPRVKASYVLIGADKDLLDEILGVGYFEKKPPCVPKKPGFIPLN